MFLNVPAANWYKGEFWLTCLIPTVFAKISACWMKDTLILTQSHSYLQKRPHAIRFTIITFPRCTRVFFLPHSPNPYIFLQWLNRVKGAELFLPLKFRHIPWSKLQAVSLTLCSGSSHFSVIPLLSALSYPPLSESSPQNSSLCINGKGREVHSGCGYCELNNDEKERNIYINALPRKWIIQLPVK